jgi:hypothetical protein
MVGKVLTGNGITRYDQGAYGLEVDHIIPKTRAAPTPSPTCRRSACAATPATYGRREAGCVFCVLEGSGRVLLENELALCIAEVDPVSEGHSLVIPRRHVAAPAGFPVPPGARTHASTGQATPIQERRCQRSESWRPCRAITRIAAPCSRK